MSGYGISSQQQYGGMGNLWTGENVSFNGIGDSMGRWFNDLTGKTATNAFNAAEAQKTRDWQTEMSNTAYQRQVADMKAAGINPSMAAQSGGASVPNGATAAATGAGNGGLLGAIFTGLAGVVGKVAAAKVAQQASMARTASEAANIGFKATRAVEMEALKFRHASALQEARMYHHPFARVAGD